MSTLPLPPPPPDRPNPSHPCSHPAKAHFAQRLGLDPRHLLLAADGRDPEVGLSDEVFLRPAQAAQLPVVESQPRLHPSGVHVVPTEPNQTAEPNRTEPNRTQPSRTEPNQIEEPHRTKPIRSDPNQTEEPNRPEPESNRPKPIRTEPNPTEPNRNRIDPNRPKPDRTEPNRVSRGGARGGAFRSFRRRLLLSGPFRDKEHVTGHEGFPVVGTGGGDRAGNTHKKRNGVKEAGGRGGAGGAG